MAKKKKKPPPPKKKAAPKKKPPPKKAPKKKVRASRPAPTRGRLSAHAFSVTVGSPASDGVSHPVSGNTISCSGSSSGGTLLRIYGKVFPGDAVQTTDVGQKPWPWHESAPVPVEGTVSGGSSWTITGVPRATADGSGQTLVVWADFDHDSTYVMRRRNFVGVGSGSGGSGMFAARGRAAQAAKPRQYRRHMNPGPIELPPPDGGALKRLLRSDLLLAFETEASTPGQFVWRSMPGSKDHVWTLRVDHSHGRPTARLSLEYELGSPKSQLVQWQTRGWDYLSRNVLKLDRPGTLPDIVLEPA